MVSSGVISCTVGMLKMNCWMPMPAKSVECDDL